MARSKRAKHAKQPSPKKRAKHVGTPHPEKAATNLENPHLYKSQRPAWRFRFIDQTGDWAITDNTLTEIVHKHLKPYETTTWAEIEAETTGSRQRHKKHHSMEVADLPKKAQDRWRENKLNFDTVFRFRFGSRLRLWGIRVNNVFKPVWWDADHSVYPKDPQ